MYSLNMNAQDKANEERIIGVFLKYANGLHNGKRRFTAEKIPEVKEGEFRKALDYRILEGDVIVAYAEVKRRNLDYAGMVRLGGLFLSEKKYKVLRRRTGSFRCIYIAELNDVIGYHSINDDRIVDKFMGGGGATNRNSPDDIERMFVFDPNQFKVISERNPNP